jgi:hypothetical protein
MPPHSDSWNEDELDEGELPDEADTTAEDDSVDLVPCPACGADVPDLADRCPACGQWITPGAGGGLSARVKMIVLLIVVLVAAGVLLLSW